MKYRIFSVLMILAMVASLCVIAAVPASAQVSNITVTLSDTSAGKTSRWQIDFTNGTALAASADDIIVEFPSAADVPASIDGSKVSVDDMPCTAVNGGDVAVSGKKVIITVPQAVGGAAACKVVFLQGAGIVNPNVSQESLPPDTAVDAPYMIKVSTTQDTTPVMSPAVTITDWFTASDLTLYEGQPCTVNGGGFWPGSTVVLSGPISGSALVGSNGKFTATAYGAGASGTATATDGSGRTAQLGGFQVMPSISVSPDSGPVTKGVQVKGKNFFNPLSGTPSTPIQLGTIMFGGATWVPAGPVTSVDLDNDNAFDDWVMNLSVPRMAQGGLNEISVIDVLAIGAPVATGQFDVTPRTVTVDPASGGPGSAVTIQGIGWPPGEPTAYEPAGIDLDGNGITNYNHGLGGIAVLIYGNTTAAGVIGTNIEVDDLGNFTAVGNIPGNAQPGVHGVLVFFDPSDQVFNQPDLDQLSAQGMFTVTDRDLTVIPSSGPYGTNITISGGNFGTIAGSGTAMLQVNNGASMSTLTLSTSGDIIPATLQVVPPALAPPAPGFSVGVNEVKATNVPNNIAAVSYFEVTRPTMTMDRDRGPRGTKVVITGGGWLPGEINFVQIQMFDPTATTPAWKTVKTATPDENGSIWASLQIPASVSVLGGAANVRFRAIDTNSNKTLETVFVVTQPAITVDPEAAAPGEMIKIIGTGFLPQAPVGSITLGGARIVRSDDLPLTDRQGGFEVMGIVPGLAPGGYAVTATVVTSVNVPFTVMATGEGDITVPVGFATIEGLYTIVWTFDAATQQWQVYDIAEGAPDDFDTLIKGQGYWLYVTEDCTLSFGQYTYNLKKGWNLIGWLG